jgi:hypothetical protein
MGQAPIYFRHRSDEYYLEPSARLEYLYTLAGFIGHVQKRPCVSCWNELYVILQVC